MIKAKYTCQFVIVNRKVSSVVIAGEENATASQKSAMASCKTSLKKFIRERLKRAKDVQDCVLNVRVSYLETNTGLQIAFRFI